MKIRYKKLCDQAKEPSYAHPGDAGLDLTAVWKEEKGNKVFYGTGLAFEIPEGFVGLVFPRSSVYKSALRLANAVGVIDSGYRGEVKLIFDRLKDETSASFSIGERIAQLLILPCPHWDLEEREELSNTERAKDGFGSSGS